MSLHNKTFFKRRLYTLRMAESTMVIDHINTLNILFSQLTIMEYKIEDNECVEILLQNLPDSYDQLIINVTSNAVTLVFKDLTVAILKEENRHKNKEDRLASSQ
ncbi:hypothetical protein TorRG33x02_019700 [Trema orientale]|uniref:Uncharacterized protein n=1 Tax=Trema orientale TaxID=63057 RepID=A0A2P5FWK9_TREOI|nr:hypothetical protein TorRG33x02_019700 [Trema orientale]